MSLNNLLNQSRQSFAEFWAARNARERMMLAAAAAVATLGMVYAVMIDPALTGRERLRNDLPVLRQQVAQLQTLSKEVSALSEKIVPSTTAMTKEGIETALAHRGLKPQSVILTGNHAKVQLTAVSFAAMLAWLDDVQKSVPLSVVEANIVALAQTDMVDATLTLRQPGNE